MVGLIPNDTQEKFNLIDTSFFSAILPFQHGLEVHAKGHGMAFFKNFNSTFTLHKAILQDVEVACSLSVREVLGSNLG